MAPLDLNDVPQLGERGAPRDVRSAPPIDDARAGFRQAAAARGVLLPPKIIADGDIHRCDTTGRHGDGDAAYIFHEDGLPAGAFKNWQDGLPGKDWHADPGRPL